MPIYMDRHDLDNVTAKDVAEAHMEDLKIQHKYQCKGLTYWFDEKRGTAFCLIEAPSSDCVERMHNDAHGLVPHQIIEVESNVVNAFLGRIKDPQSSEYLDDMQHPIINESAFRIIMYVSLKDAMLLKLKLEKNKAVAIINSARDVIQKSMNRYSGHEVKKDRNRVIISFTSAASAVMCALEIQHEIKSNAVENFKLKVKISLSAGSPVTGQNQLFGETVQLAERLCDIANQEQVVISSEVSKVYKDEILEGLSKEIPVQTISPDDENDGDNGYGAGISYENAGVLVFADYITNDTGKDDSAYKLGGKYTLNNLSLYGQYEFDKGLISSKTPDTSGEGADLWMLGASYTLGNSMVYFGYGTSDNGSNGSKLSSYNVWELVGTHNMSKRTKLYAGFSEIDCDDQDDNVCSRVGKKAGEDDKFSLGMQHQF